MGHASDGVAAVGAASRILAVRGRAEPQETMNPEIGWATTAGAGVWAPTRDGRRIHIGIGSPAGGAAATVIRPSLRVFADIDTDADVVAQTTAVGVRLITVLHGPDAPDELRFPLSLADGLVLERMPSGGLDVVLERFGATVGRFFAPWACDSAFRPVSAQYGLEDTTIVMKVPHQGATYPIVADPHYTR